MTGMSVVVPCFDAEDHVDAAVERLLAQTQPDLEVVLVDDASTDSTAARIRAWADRDPRVVPVLLPRNGGVAAAREAGVRAASGPYIWFVDADDEWPADAAAGLLDAAVRHDGDLVVARAVTRFPDGRTKPVGTELVGVIPPDTAFRHFLRGRVTGHLWNKLFRRDLLLGIEFPRMRHHSDQAMVAQSIATARTVVAVDVDAYVYVLRQGSIIRSGRPRRESLARLAGIVQASAARLGLAGGEDHRYYRARYDVLSRLKDATSGAYDAAEAKVLVSAARRSVSPTMVMTMVRSGDRRRLALLLAGWMSMPLYRRAMSRPGARD